MANEEEIDKKVLDEYLNDKFGPEPEALKKKTKKEGQGSEEKDE